MASHWREESNLKWKYLFFWRKIFSFINIPLMKPGFKDSRQEDIVNSLWRNDVNCIKFQFPLTICWEHILCCWCHAYSSLFFIKYGWSNLCAWQKRNLEKSNVVNITQPELRDSAFHVSKPHSDEAFLIVCLLMFYFRWFSLGTPLIC